MARVPAGEQFAVYHRLAEEQLHPDEQPNHNGDAQQVRLPDDDMVSALSESSVGNTSAAEARAGPSGTGRKGSHTIRERLNNQLDELRARRTAALDFFRTRGSLYSLNSDDGESAVDVDLENATDLRLRLNIVVEMFFIQFLAPFSVPYVWARFGFQAAVNMQLVKPPRLFLKENCTLERLIYSGSWLLTLFAICVFVRHREQLLASHITAAELLHALLMFASHRAMVAVKYATMTENELRLFLNVSYERAMRYNQRVQLLSGVWYPQRDMVYKEVERAWRFVLCTGVLPPALACKHTLQYRFAVERGEEERWKRLLEVLGECSPFESQGDPPAFVRVDDVLCALVLHSTNKVVTKQFRARVMWIARFVGIYFAAMPSLLRWSAGVVSNPPECNLLRWDGEAHFLTFGHVNATDPGHGSGAGIHCVHPVGDDPIDWLAVLSVALITMTWWRTDVLFLIATFSSYRRITVQREMLSALITDHDGFVSGNAGPRVSDWPTIRPSDPSAVRVFSLLWKLQLSYGRAYQLRMTVYNGFSLTVAVVLSVYLVAVIMQYDEGAVADEAIPIEDQLAYSLPVNLVLSLVIVLTCIFLVQLRAGSEANSQVDTLAVHMFAAGTSAHYHLETINHAEATMLANTPEHSRMLSDRHLAMQAIELLHHEQQAVIKIHNENPVRLLGLRASMNLAVTLGSAVLTAFIFFAEKVYDLSLPFAEMLL